jgi:3-oxoacyl-[acyl-carrier protein] reductase
MRYDGKVIVVTGAGSGMGRAMAHEFVSLGGRVAVLGRSAANIAETAASIDNLDFAKPYQVDVTDEEQVKSVITSILADWGRVDLLCNNAGVLGSYRSAHEVTLNEWNEIMAINVTGPFLTSKHVIPHMLELGKGGIINVASTSAYSAAGGGSAYTASKHALLGLTRQLCFEYGGQGIRVNAICPGATATPMAMPTTMNQAAPDMQAAVERVPARRWCKPSEIAKLAAFLGSDDADYVHGSAYVIDGGWLTAAREAY